MRSTSQWTGPATGEGYRPTDQESSAINRTG